MAYTTKRFNEAFKRKPRDFPADFACRLTAREFAALRSQIATLNKDEVGPFDSEGNSSRFATSSNPARCGAHRKYLPWAFTEHGCR